MARFTNTPEGRAQARATSNARWAAASPEQRKEQGRAMQEGLAAANRAKQADLDALREWLANAQAAFEAYVAKMDAR